MLLLEPPVGDYLYDNDTQVQFKFNCRGDFLYVGLFAPFRRFAGRVTLPAPIASAIAYDFSIDRFSVFYS